MNIVEQCTGLVDPQPWFVQLVHDFMHMVLDIHWLFVHSVVSTKKRLCCYGQDAFSLNVLPTCEFYLTSSYSFVEN